MRIVLELPEDVDSKYRTRLTYAFRLFCAIYGHQPIEERTKAASGDVTLCYGSPLSGAPSRRGPVVWLSRGYRTRDPRAPAPPPLNYANDDVSTWVHHLPVAGSVPDWLGEIFEWVSCADEYSVTERDGVGRPLFAATYAGRHKLDTSVPYAGIAMRCLQREICRVVPGAAEGPARPGKAAHLVVPTHDVDYFPAGRFHALNRLARNAVVSCIAIKRPKLALRQSAMAASLAIGRVPDPLDRIGALVEGEQRRGIGASYNFLARHIHRRDAHYGLEHKEVLETMRWLEAQGMEVGIHETYTCHDEPEGVARELALFRARGFSPRGGRQHWLRYTLDRLIPAAEHAGLTYDTSIGYSENLGFRAGACFAFPPYNFAEERAATFLEIPMAMMDQAFPMQLQGAEEMFEAATALLSESRRLGWGGISLLWHPPAFGEGWLPSEVGELYWQLADRRVACDEQWISAQEFIAAVRPRYVDTGLLPAEEPSPAEEMPVDESAAVAMAVRPGRLAGTAR